MTERATCKTCRWWQECGPHPASPEGTCNIRSVPGDFPRSHQDDWCGEHQPREVENE